MNIRSAEQHLDVLLRYVNDLKDTRPRMYKKSKDRLIDIASTCNEVIGIISDILRDEVMDVDTDEFGTNSSSEISNIVKSMETRISDLADFVSVSPEDDVNELTNKNVYLRYRDCLKSASKYKYYVSDYAYDCVNMIWRWYECRFVRFGKSSNGFVYNIHKLKDWISYFVILYGYHFRYGTLDEFKRSLNSWIADIHSNGSKYAIPKDIYLLDKSDDKKYYTIESVILWDLLLESDFSRLCDIDSDYYPYSDCVYNTVYKFNQDELDDYIDYKVDYSILIKYGFVDGGDSE